VVFSSYLTGATYGQYSSSLNGEQLGFVGRVAGRPYYDNDWNVNLGFLGEWVFHPNLTKSGTPFVSQETLTFQNQPEDRVDVNNLISTGALSASGAYAYGGGGGVSWRNLLVQGEYYQIQVNQLLPPGVRSPVLGFNGGYVEAGWVLTGEPIQYNAGAAAFARPKVAEPFTLNGGGLGACGALQRDGSEQQCYARRAAERHRRCVRRFSANLRRGAQLVPERLGSVHADVPVRQCGQAEFGGNGPARPEIRGTRRPGANCVLRPRTVLRPHRVAATPKIILRARRPGPRRGAARTIEGQKSATGKSNILGASWRRTGPLPPED
jgi:Phosphate-selective porin O and P